MRFPTSQQPAPGLGFGNDIAVMLSPAGDIGHGAGIVNIGDCVAVDATIVDGSFRWTTVRQVVTADFLTASGAANAQTMVAIAIDNATVGGTKIRCVFRGQVAALCVSAITVGVTRLSPTNVAAGLTATVAATGTGQRVVAIAVETVAAANVLKNVMFDGVDGVFGGAAITNTT